MGEKENNGGCEPGPAPCSCSQKVGIEPFPAHAADKNGSCCGSTEIASFQTATQAVELCCGPPPAPESDPFEKPGYMLHSFVAGFENTPVGTVPRVTSRLDRTDIRGSVMARLGLTRNDYKIAPGLYCIGKADSVSPVLVSANYKLSFDALRRELNGVDAWILVLDTRGVNVWCAAGKSLFSTAEVVRRVQASSLDRVVSHSRLILPQLSATGVSAPAVKKGCGFKVVWGPIRARDIKQFISDGMKADTPMRRVTFTTPERLVLIPVEITLITKHALWLLAAVFLLSGIGPGIFSFGAAWLRGILLAAACGLGAGAGTVAAPALLPWLPGKAFSVKGLLTGLVAGFLSMWLFRQQTGGLEALALLLSVSAISSFLTMNFTGSTPFTSPSGVEKEMRKAIPFQAGALLVAAVVWVGAAFAG